MNEVQKRIEKFVSELIDYVRAEVRAEMLEAITGGSRSIHTRVGAKKLIDGISVVQRQRRKGPVQLCPIPNCKNRAAPVFGMVCAAHKGTPKALIKKYRDARRASKEGGKVIPIHTAKKAKAAKAAKAAKKVVTSKNHDKKVASATSAKKPEKAQAA